MSQYCRQPLSYLTDTCPTFIHTYPDHIQVGQVRQGLPAGSLLAYCLLIVHRAHCCLLFVQRSYCCYVNTVNTSNTVTS